MKLMQRCMVVIVHHMVIMVVQPNHVGFKGNINLGIDQTWW
jgi:hypothetical protein